MWWKYIHMCDGSTYTCVAQGFKDMISQWPWLLANIPLGISSFIKCKCGALLPCFTIKWRGEPLKRAFSFSSLLSFGWFWRFSWCTWALTLSLGVFGFVVKRQISVFVGTRFVLPHSGGSRFMVFVPTFVVAIPCARHSCGLRFVLLWFHDLIVRCGESMTSSFVWFEVHGVGADDFRGTWFSVHVVCSCARVFLVTLGVFVLGGHCHHGYPSLPFLYCTTLIYLA